jgi:hypothetical protein
MPDFRARPLTWLGHSIAISPDDLGIFTGIG